jgi:signal peptidase I
MGKRGLEIISAIGIVLLIMVLFPFITGSLKPMIVLSGSMTPVMLPGDMIIVQKIDPTTLNVGDVIAFQQPGGKPNTVFTHRIIDIRNSNNLTFQTKGDANNVQDDFRTPAANVKGKLIFVIPYLGWLPEVAKNKWVFFGTIIIPVVILIFDEIRNMLIYSNPSKTRKHEKEKKKLEARTTKNINYKWLTALTVPISVVMLIIMITNIGAMGSITINSRNTIYNNGFLPSVYVITTDDTNQQFNVQPWYGIIESQSSVQVNSPLPLHAQVSTTPYLIPVDWIIILARMNSYLPQIAILIGYVITVMFVGTPLWYRKKIKGNYAKKMKKNTMFVKFKKMLHV